MPYPLTVRAGETTEASEGYYERRKAGQGKWVRKLREAVGEVSASSEYKENGSDKPIALTEVPFFDVELVGIPALYYLGSQCYTENPSFSHLMEEGKLDRITLPRFIAEFIANSFIFICR